VQIGRVGRLRLGFDEHEPAMSKLKDMEWLFNGRHFDREIIVLCVRWYLRYKLSLRDLVEMMAERGLSLSHTTIMRWVKRFTPEFVKRWDRYARSAGRSWRVDESVSRTQAKACGAVLKMGVGLPKPACRSRLQTARCCCVQKAWW
jgi:transposase-like protein